MGGQSLVLWVNGRKARQWQVATRRAAAEAAAAACCASVAGIAGATRL